MYDLIVISFFFIYNLLYLLSLFTFHLRKLLRIFQKLREADICKRVF